MLQAGTAVGRYVIQRKLAEGGMAEIYLATATGAEGFSKEVVIKVVRAFLAKDAQFVQMFIAEARLVSRLNHANIVQIFDFGKHEDTYFLAMEYVRGASLWELRKRCRELGLPFPAPLGAEIAAQVARGLHFAHSLAEGGVKVGVVHRDVTPHNILLSFDGAVKLTDFGIAKAADGHTSPGMLKGKFAYMAPEQARGEAVDARTDVFALGIVTWELLTGGRLFEGDSDVAVLRAVQESLIAPPSRLNPDVPRELSEVVMKALSRRPEERFQTAGELERALATFAHRASRSLEDTSVSHFLQRLFREEFDLDTAGPVSRDLPFPDPGEGRSAETVGRRRSGAPGTVTTTPVGTVARSAPPRPPSTEQLPPHRPGGAPAPGAATRPGRISAPRLEPAPGARPFDAEPSEAPPAPAGRPVLLALVAILAGVGALGGGAAMTIYGRSAATDRAAAATPGPGGPGASSAVREAAPAPPGSASGSEAPAPAVSGASPDAGGAEPAIRGEATPGAGDAPPAARDATPGSPGAAPGDGGAPPGRGDATPAAAGPPTEVERAAPAGRGLAAGAPSVAAVAPARGAPGVRPGTLKVLLRPFGFVSLNGSRKLEVPGSRQLSLKPGRYELELFDNHQVSVRRLTLTLEPGGVQTVEAD
jgi:serine/threonine-protein kinase